MVAKIEPLRQLEQNISEGEGTRIKVLCDLSELGSGAKPQQNYENFLAILSI